MVSFFQIRYEFNLQSLKATQWTKLIPIHTQHCCNNLCLNEANVFFLQFHCGPSACCGLHLHSAATRTRLSLWFLQLFIKTQKNINFFLGVLTVTIIINDNNSSSTQNEIIKGQCTHFSVDWLSIIVIFCENSVKCRVDVMWWMARSLYVIDIDG